jgi:1,4-dihydroxy-2-naphthoate octaprenyltransferase
MTHIAEDNFPREEPLEDVPGFLHFAGFRYWTASLLPALVGTTLPFWLRPPGFSFRWLGAIEFLFTTVLLHAGFSFLLAWFGGRLTTRWPRRRLLGYAGMCIVVACVLGLHLNNGLVLHKGVPRSIFIVYGLAALFVGVLYVVPPLNFYRRVGGEIVISQGLGMIPVLGAYLVQVGDITRTVYLASLPLIVATGLWVWIDELAGRVEDEKAGRRTMVIDFGPHFSGRYGVLALSMLWFATLLLAVFSASIVPLALVALLAVGLVWKIVTVSWNEYSSTERMVEIRKHAFVLHLATCSIIAVSSLVTQFTNGLAGLG